VRVPRFVHPAPGVTLWAHMVPGPATDPVLLVADAGASLALWPQPLISALAAHHPVLCYDHRDTGRSRTSAAPGPDASHARTSAAPDPDAGHAGATAAVDPDAGWPLTMAAVDADRAWPTTTAADHAGTTAVDVDPDLEPERPTYGVATLAADAVAVLDAYEVARAHVLGWGMGGLVAQLLLLDHPTRLASATLIATRPLRAPGTPVLPGPPTALRRLWAELDDPRDREGELAWRVAHDRLLHGAALPFDAAAFRARHERAMAHAGTEEPVTAHTHLAVPSRGAELAAVTVPTLVVEAPADPVHPPPAAAALAAALGRARLVGIPGLGRVAGDRTAQRLAEIVVDHTMSIPTSA
jgi:pimeloyl-ACP methyl ester carboxylesterase